jgi:hypothetical protein
MHKSPIFYVAIGFILAFFLMGIIVMLVPELRPYAMYKEAGAETDCGDGIDNDGNGLVDMDDPGCYSGDGGLEDGTDAMPPSGPVCGDGVCESDEDSASCPSDCGEPPAGP